MKKHLGCYFLIFFPNAFFCFLGGMPPVRLYSTLLVGWVAFARDTAAKVTVNPAAVATFAVTLALVTAGVHFFASWLRRSMRPEAPPWRGRWTAALVALFVLAFVAGIAAVGIVHQTAWLATSPDPFFEEVGGGRRRRNEMQAIFSLKALVTSQSIFREGDKEEDGLLDYGTLDELLDAKVVDSVLGSGTKQGYVFEVAPSTISPELAWFAVASPAHPAMGERFFFTNQSGVIYYTKGRPIAFNRATCDVPPDVLPLGK
ncbi:MAG: hypothetical protein ACAI25_15250 [Planctomycetota bacterium]